MIGAEVQRGLQEHDRITGQNALADAVAQALFNGRDEVLRHAAADRLIREDHLFGLGLRLEADINVAELAVAAGLLLVTAVDLDLLLDGLAVGDLCRAELGFDLILAQELGNDDAQVDVADTGDDHFLRLRIVAVGEGGVFLVQLDETGGDLVFLTLRLGVDGHAVAGLCIGHGLDGDKLAGLAERVAGADGGKLREHADVAAADLRGLGVVLALREERVAELFIVAGAGVNNGHGVFDVAGEDLEVGVFAVLVGDGVEHERGRGAVGIQRELGLLAFLVDANGGLALQRGRRKADEVVQQGGGAEAVHRAAAEDRRDGALTDAVLDALEQLFFGERLLHEELLHEGFVGLGDLLIQLGHVLFNLLFRLGGQGDLLAGDVVGLLGDEIDNADGLFAVQDREREGDDGGTEDVAQGVERIEEVRMLLVELRNIEHCGQTGVGQGFPALLGADGDAGLRGQADQAGIRNAQGLYDLRSKVKVAGVVQYVELAAAEFDGDDRSLDGVLSLLLFVIKVRNGRAVGALAETGDRFGHIKHALAQGGLAVAAVAQQSKVADILRSVHS